MYEQSLASKLIDEIHHSNIYDGFDWAKYPDDLTGGELYPVFEELIKSIRPQFILEIGSWKGKSSVHMVELQRKYKIPDPVVMCVDTWLGSDPVHQWRYKDHEIWGMKNMYDHGYPTIYKQFLSNVCRHKCEDAIVPFPNTSYVAAEWLMASKQYQPGMIYIDGCHDEDECYLDIKRLWPLLPKGGVMIGDDFEAGWYGVICAVNHYAREYGIQLQIAPGNKWLMQKS